MTRKGTTKLLILDGIDKISFLLIVFYPVILSNINFLAVFAKKSIITLVPHEIASSRHLVRGTTPPEFFEIEMKSLYYGIWGKQEYFREVYMGNPGYYNGKSIQVIE